MKVMNDFTGKVLEDPLTLTASNLTNGSKLMLVASQGLYQGVLYMAFLISFSVLFFLSVEIVFSKISFYFLLMSLEFTHYT